MNEKQFLGGMAGVLVSLTGMTLESANYIVSMICSGLGLLITLTASVIIPVIIKWRAAKADGKITADEAQDMAETALKGLEDVKRELDGHKED